MVSLREGPIDRGGGPPRIEIIGVFGSGKTTLAAKLSGASTVALLENHEANPFWGKSTVNARLGFLPYDLSFLIQHLELVVSSPMKDGTIYVADWSTASDRLWASLRLGADFSLYRDTFDALWARVGPPAGYLYLRHPPELIVQRIVQRDRLPEKELVSQIVSACDSLDSCVAALPADRVAVVSDEFDRARLKQLTDRWMENLSG